MRTVVTLTDNEVSLAVGRWLRQEKKIEGDITVLLSVEYETQGYGPDGERQVPVARVTAVILENEAG